MHDLKILNLRTEKKTEAALQTADASGRWASGRIVTPKPLELATGDSLIVVGLLRSFWGKNSQNSRHNKLVTSYSSFSNSKRNGRFRFSYCEISYIKVHLV